MLVWSSRKHINTRGDSWSAYDSLFRQHAAANPDLPWATLDGSIHAVTFLASRTRMDTHCRQCADSDHLAHECALTPMLNSSQSTRYVASQSSHRTTWPGSPSNTSTRPICNSWNREKYAYAPVCSYRHVCATCQEGPHQAKDCAHTPADSIFRRPPPPPRQGGRENRT